MVDPPRTEETAEEEGEGSLPSDLLRRIAAAPEVAVSGALALDQPDLSPGTVIDDHLRIDDRLGVGGMGIVYRATDLDLHRAVAVKVHHARDAGGVDRLLREAKALAQLSHPNVVTVHEVGTVDGRLFMAMELAEGGNVRDWVATEKPSTNAILAVFIAAGRGLAAAHAAGLVHRDFKPENILLGGDGAVRVGDFGLVRATREREPREVTGELEPPISDHTVPGAVMGTPAYMAPEQHAGAEVDARADQFSYCVALCEALTGVRPFRGRTRPEIVAAIMAGDLALEVADPAIPRRVMRILRRGLRPDPDQRYPDMAALLTDLERDPARTARRWLVAGGAVVAIAGVAAIAGSRYGGRLDPCSGGGAEMGLSWSHQGGAVTAAFRATKAPYVETTLATIDQFLTDHDRRLRAGAVAACRATRVEGLQSERALDLRSACLRSWRDQANALVVLFAAADAKVVERAVSALAALPPLAHCDEVDPLLAGVAPPPEDRRVAVAAVHEITRRARGLSSLGKLAEARATTAGLVEQARATGYQPLLADVLSLVGGIAQASGDEPGSEATLTEAFFTARHANHSEIALQTANMLLFAVGSDPARYAEAELWARHAEVELDRGWRGTTLEAEVLTHRAAVAEGAGKYDEAHRLYLQALEQLGDEPSVALAHVLNGVGSSLHALGRLAEAASFYQRGVVLIEELLGPEHPDITYPLSNLGLLEADRGDHDRAIEHLRRVVAIDERAFGPDNVNTAYAVLNLGVALHGKQEYPAALAAYRRALAIIEARLGKDHADAALCLNSIGVTLAAMNDSPAALDHYQRALAVVDRLDDHPQVAAIATNIADLLQFEGRFEEAMPYLTRALDIWERTAPGSAYMVQTLTCYGLSLVELRRSASAVAALERAVMLGVGADVSEDQLAKSRYGLARAYRLADRDCHRARAVASQAAEGYDRAGKRFTTPAREVLTWLAGSCPTRKEREQ